MFVFNFSFPPIRSHLASEFVFFSWVHLVTVVSFFLFSLAKNSISYVNTLSDVVDLFWDSSFVIWCLLNPSLFGHCCYVCAEFKFTSGFTESVGPKCDVGVADVGLFVYTSFIRNGRQNILRIVFKYSRNVLASVVYS